MRGGAAPLTVFLNVTGGAALLLASVNIGIFAFQSLNYRRAASQTQPAALSAAPGQAKHLFLGGVLVAFYVLSITWVAPRFGLGNAITCVLLGQLLSAAVIDQWGLMGAIVREVTPVRAAGLAIMAIGVVLTQRG